MVREGERLGAVVVLLDGLVKVVASSYDGDEHILALRGPGEVIGDLSVICDSTASATVEVLEDVDATVVAAGAYLEFLRGHPEFMLGQLRRVIEVLRQSDSKRLELATLDLTARVARGLLESAMAGGTAAGGATGSGTGDHGVPVSQEELAHLCGASREAVARVLRTFRDRGWVRTERRAWWSSTVTAWNRSPGTGSCETHVTDDTPAAVMSVTVTEGDPSDAGHSDTGLRFPPTTRPLWRDRSPGRARVPPSPLGKVERVPVRSCPVEKYQCFIGGEWVDGEGGSYEIVNPATEEVVGHAPQVTVEQSLAATAAAADAFEAWSRTTPEHRAELLERVADLVDERTDRARPTRAGRDRRHDAGHQDHAGAPGRGEVPALRQGRVRVADSSRSSRRSCRRRHWPPAA